MAFDLFGGGQKQSTSVTESQVGVQGGGSGSGTVGFGSISTGAKSASKVAQGGGSVIDLAGSRESNVFIQSLDPLAIEAVAQSNLVVGEIASRGMDAAAQSNLVVGEIAARGFESAKSLAAQSNALALSLSDRASGLADKVSDVAKQGINYANQSLIKALEALQIISGGEATPTGALEEKTLDLPIAAKKSLTWGWVTIAVIVIAVFGGAYWFFFRKK